MQPLDPPPEDNSIIDDDDDWAGSPLVATATAEERVADSTLPIEKEKGQDAKNALGSLQQQPQKPSPPDIMSLTLTTIVLLLMKDLL